MTSSKQNTKDILAKSGFLPMDIEAVRKHPDKSEITTGDATDVVSESPPEREIVFDIPIGLNEGGKTLVTCEKGIKAFVKDELAKKDNHLPKSETGVWIHYLTEGIKRDYGRTWEKLPKSLKPKETTLQKASKDKKRVITKAEKNALLAQLDMNYYQRDIQVGNLTLEEAFEKIKQAFDRKQELENAGYYLSPNKTEGVKPFNWEKLVEESVGSIDAAEVYKFNKIDLILPNLIENFYQNPRKQKRGIIKDIMASALYGTAFDKAWQSGVKDYGYYDEDHPEAGGAQTFEVNTMDDLLNYFVEQGLEDKVTDLKKNFTINSVHLAKNNRPGFRKDRLVCFDLTKNKDGSRELHLWGKDSSITMLRDDTGIGVKAGAYNI